MSEVKVKLREIILEIARMEIVEDSEKLFANPDCDLMSDWTRFIINGSVDCRD